MKLLLVGDFQSDISALERSYARAFRALGHQVECFDIVQSIAQSVRLGRIGQIINARIPVEVWLQQANRRLVIAALERAPDIIVTFGKYSVRSGALAQIKASTNAMLVHIWPDTLVNWNDHLTTLLPLCDLVGTYSLATMPMFKQLGAGRVIWLPLAADPWLFNSDGNRLLTPGRRFDTDISFIGGWRPEREEILKQLSKFQLKIWGPDWGVRCGDKRLVHEAWQGKGLYGTAFAKAVSESKINLNIIDTTNFPAANMRFFELLAVGGVQLSTSSPEMEDIFIDKRHLFYFRNAANLIDLLDNLLPDETIRYKVGSEGQALILSSHTYVHRASTLLRELGLQS